MRFSACPVSIAFGFAVLLSEGSLKADPLTAPIAFAIGHACIDPIDTTFGCVGSSVFFGGPGSNSFAYSGAIVDPNLGSTLYVAAGGTATFSKLGAFSTTSLFDPNLNTGTDTNAAAEMTDIMTISAGDLTGTGYLVIQSTLTGTTSQYGSGRSLVGVGVCLCGFGPSPDRQFIFGQIGEVVFQPVAFQFGVPFNLDFGLGTFTDEGTGDGSAAASFFDTAAITGLKVFDANMTPIGNPTFSTESGTRYTVNGVVPEPSSTGLTFAGIAAWALLRSLKQRNSRTQSNSSRQI